MSMEDEGDEPEFCLMQENGVLKPAGRFCEKSLSMAEGVEPWMAIDYGEVLQALAETKQMELGAVSRRYGEITLRVSREEVYRLEFISNVLKHFAKGQDLKKQKEIIDARCVSRPLKEGASCLYSSGK